MGGFEIENIAAYRIIKEILDHSWNLPEFPSNKEIYTAINFFSRLGGSWEKLMAGDMTHVDILEIAMEAAFKDKIDAKLVEKVSDQ
jgi:hypothetical protein